MSRVSLSVMGITQCPVCLWGNQGPSMSWVNSWVGYENSQWEEKSLKVSVSLSVRVSLSVMGILLGVSGFRGFRVSVCVRSSDILLARFVRRLIGRKGGRDVSSLSLTHTHTQIRRWVLTHSHTQLGLVLGDFTVSEGHGHPLVILAPTITWKKVPLFIWQSSRQPSISLKREDLMRYGFLACFQLLFLTFKDLCSI